VLAFGDGRGDTVSSVARTGGRQTGASLLEVLVAMLLLSLMLMGLASSVPLALRGVAEAGRRTALVLLAQQAVEMARATPVEALAGLDSGGFVELPDHSGTRRSVSVAFGTPTAGTATVTAVARGTGPEGGDVVVTTVVGP
jgi:Tfp pilus assembly protein PilV